MKAPRPGRRVRGARAQIVVSRSPGASIPRKSRRWSGRTDRMPLTNLIHKTASHWTSRRLDISSQHRELESAGVLRCSMALSGDLTTTVSRLGMMRASRRLRVALWYWHNACERNPSECALSPKSPQYLQMYFRVPTCCRASVDLTLNRLSCSTKVACSNARFKRWQTGSKLRL